MTPFEGAHPQASEKSIQHWCAQTFRAAGCLVYNLSQARASKQTPGLPDLWVFVPRRGTAFWFETKSPRGVQSEAQAAFQASCEGCGIRYVMGGMEEARAILAELRLTA